MFLQESLATNAMEMGQIIQAVGHEWALLKLFAVNEREKR